jgi:hypothetical protein
MIIAKHVLFIKAGQSGRSLAGIVGSNPAGGMDVCLLWVLCVVRWRSLRRADHSSRGILLTVLRRYVWFKNLKNEETKASIGRQRHRGGGNYLLIEKR